MSRPALFVLFSIHVKSKFRFAWPIPLFSFLMLSDMFVDLTDFLALFSRKDHPDGQKSSVRALNKTARCVHAALSESIAITEPWELLNVETESVRMRLLVA